MNPVLLVDLSAIFRAAWHANADGPTSVSFQATLDGIRRCQNLAPDSLVAICCDGRGNWRKALSPDYKMHREKQPEAMYGVLDRVKQRLTEDGYLLWQCDGYEADDLIAGATARAVEAGHDVVIASHDKDVTQLVSDHVRMLKTSTWDFVGPAEVVAKFGVEPAGVADFLSLTGDSSDGIKGVPSVGPKTATALLIQHGGLEDIYRKIDALQVLATDKGPQVVTMTPDAKAIATPAIVDKLWRHKADAMLARKLVELRTDAPVNFSDIYERRTPVTKTNSKTTNLDADDDVPISKPTTKEAIQPDPKANVGAEPGQVVDSAASPIRTDAAGAHPTSSATVQTPVAMSAPAESRALVPFVESEYIHALEPRTAQQALTLGEVLYESRAFTRFPTAQAITAVIMEGRELGISAIAALRAFHYAADLGRSLPTWQLIVTLAERSPDCEYFRWVGGNESEQTWETKHRKHPEPTRMTYRIEQAAKAGLLKKDKPLAAWNARPDEMLRKTSACQLARAVYPGPTMGLYCSEEMGGESS